MKLLIIFLITLIYSILRYIAFGNIEIIQIPLFILNKSISFSSIIYLGYYFYNKRENNHQNTERFLKAFKTFVLIHVLISFTILTEQYFPKLFELSKLNLNGNLVILSGILGLIILFYNKFKITYHFLGILIGIHLIFLGYKSWLSPDSWNGFLPPITLICFVLLVIFSFFNYFNKDNSINKL